MFHVYCDTGGYDKRLSALEADGVIALYQFKYENRSRRIRRGSMPSDWRYSDDISYTFDDWRNDEYLKTLTFDELRNANSRYEAIARVIGNENRIDVQHLDSACMAGCQVFLTSDKTDIWSNRAELKEITGLTVFHVSSEWETFLRFVQNGG
jgi:hypothetical protein